MAAESAMITYGSPDNPQMVVRRLGPDDITPDIAHACGSLVARTLQYKFERAASEQYRLERGAVYGHYRPGHQNSTILQQRRMLDGIAEGSQYYVMLSSDDANQQQIPLEHTIDTPVVALAKVSPSRGSLLQKIHKRPPNCYLNDHFIYPSLQNRGLGSAVLHSAIVNGGFDPEGSLVYDSYDGDDDTNTRFFTSYLGLEPHPEIPVDPLLLQGDNVLTQTRYVSPEGLTLSAIRARLEEHRTFLKQFNVSE